MNAALRVGDPITITVTANVAAEHAYITSVTAEGFVCFDTKLGWQGVRLFEEEGISWCRGHATGDDATALLAALALAD